MKSRVRKLGMALAVCAAGLGMAGTSSMELAGDSFTLQATATVQGNCKLRSGVAAGGTLTLAFGTLDASTITADAVQTVQFQYSCNNGTAVTADVGASSGQTVAQQHGVERVPGALARDCTEIHASPLKRQSATRF